MTVVVVLSQPLRQSEAATYLRTRDDAKKVVVTRFLNALDTHEFPEDTTFRSWSTSPKPPPSARAVVGLGRLKRWIRSGSGLGLWVDRWARSADWRLRYLDRVFAALESGRGSRWDLQNRSLAEILGREITDDVETEIAVFDLFDLPAVVSFSDAHPCTVLVR